MLKVLKVGSTPSGYAEAEHFTGQVRRDRLIMADAPGRVQTGLVTFEPGSRTAWHHHPAGQTLYITAGCGWVQADGEPRQQVTAGDAVWIPADEKHWHGGTATTAMTHLAVTEYIDGVAGVWQELVTDEEYLRG